MAHCDYCGAKIGNYGQDRDVCRICEEETGVTAFDEEADRKMADAQ